MEIYEMINTLSFLSILIIFMRLYSIFGITFLSDAKAKFAERIAIFLLILEILITFFLLFFNSLKYILPPALIYLNTGQYEFFLFKNISIAAFLYTVLDVAILLTFNSSIETLKVFNRILLTYLFLINSILGIITLIS